MVIALMVPATVKKAIHTIPISFASGLGAKRADAMRSPLAAHRRRPLAEVACVHGVRTLPMSYRAVVVKSIAQIERATVEYLIHMSPGSSGPHADHAIDIVC